MKATLEFQLPEEQDEFIRAGNATEAYLTLWCIREKLFKEEPLTIEDFNELCEHYNINFNYLK